MDLVALGGETVRIVGLSASADGCGKTTLARHIVSRTLLEPAIVPMARALRQELHTILAQDAVFRELPTAHIVPGLMDKPTPTWARELLRSWGDYKRMLDPDYWVKRWEDRIQELEGTVELVLVDDIRYRNEADAIHAHGGSLVFLDDVGTPDNALRHELVDVRAMADIGFTVNRTGEWADPNAVMEALGLD